MTRGLRHAFLLAPLFAAAAFAQAQNAAVTIAVDALANRHADAATLNDLNVPLNRSMYAYRVQAFNSTTGRGLGLLEPGAGQGPVGSGLNR
jgi:hypothetical protein